MGISASPGNAESSAPMFSGALPRGQRYTTLTSSAEGCGIVPARPPHIHRGLQEPAKQSISQNMRVLIPDFLLVGAIACLDVAASADITLWVLYLLPLSQCTWNHGLRNGRFVASACAPAHLSTWIHNPVPAAGITAVVVLLSRCLVYGLALFLLAALRLKKVGRVHVRNPHCSTS